MKKISICVVIVILNLILLCGVFNVSAADKIAEAVSTDIRVYIDGNPIKAYNINNNMMVSAEDLDQYGFDVIYNNSYRTLYLMYDPDEEIESTYKHETGTVSIGAWAADVLKTNIVTYADGYKVDGYNIGGSTVINIEELSLVYGAECKYSNKDRTLKIKMPDKWSWEDETVLKLTEAVESYAEDEVKFVIRNRDEDIDTIVEMVRNLDPVRYYYFKWFEWNYPTNRTADVLEIGFKFNYTYEREAVMYIKEKVGEIVTAVKKMNDYDKAKYVHDYIAELVEYDHASYEQIKKKKELTHPECSDIYGAFFSKKVVCQGYAETFKYIMDELGFECLIVGGPTHAWNLLKLGDSYYHIDVTWDDPDEDSEIRYKYFCVNDEWINRDHDYRPEEGTPESTSMKYNWFVMNDCYFEKYDYEKVKEIVMEGIREGKDVEFAFSGLSEYRKIIYDLLDRDMIFDIMREMGYETRTVWTIKDEDSLVFTILLSRSF